MKSNRVSWEKYFINIAVEVSKRSTCDRKNVGAVIVKDKMILSTGYNGSIRGLPHCDEIGHEMVNGHCVRTTHAEANAILKLARSNNRGQNSTLYITLSPCKDCSKLILQAGIKRVVFIKGYKDQTGINFLQQAGIEIVQIEHPFENDEY